MADTQNLNVSKNDWNGAFVPKHSAKLIKAGIENGTAPFLPREDGSLAPEAIINANTGYVLSAKELLPVQLTKQEKGYQGNAVGTYNTMGKAETRVKEGEKGVWYNFKGQDGEFHHAAYFFAEQTEHPERFNDFAQKNSKQQSVLNGTAFTISSVQDYLPMYLAACKSGAKVSVSPEIAGQFKADMLSVCNNELAHSFNKSPDIPKLNDMLFAADKLANDLIKSTEKQLGIAPQKQQKIERNMAQTY